MSTDLPSPARGVMPWAVVAGVVLVALSLRGPIVAPAPVIGDIRADLGLSATTAGLLTSLPVLCFALATPLATRVIRRAGAELAVVACLLGVLAGTIVRSAGPAWAVFLGTVVIGAAITIGNIVVPVVIRRDVHWRRTSTVTAVYTAALNVGSMITSLGTAPLAAMVGWRGALATWGIFAALGAAYWMWLARRRTAAAAAADAAAATAAPARATGTAGADGKAPTGRAEQPPAAITARTSQRVNRIGWLLLVAFCGQSFSYYAVTAWLPTLLADTRGLDPAASGATASLFQIAAIAGSFGVPLIATRAPAWVPVAVIGGFWVALPLGLLVAPEAFTTWAIVGGIAQGGGFTAILSIIARVARTDREAASVSARVQAGGYVAATFAAPLAGALNSATGGWTAPLLLVTVTTLTFSVGGVGAALLARQRPGRQPADPD
ncbi:CP family cyanate transporter-like MFS transporter [Georgenia soli]|uniref:CP family cyanate transporter-like MFS transporter n=1 Tax=Georgenia soli TaxID=638953 RepID=A0A2A9EK61_9MICO|nr:MFS transporter [Georgenia soli]PFG39467.1 CP family cyanate transporter-like MFS transporter [Georgenia soli]